MKKLSDDRAPSISRAPSSDVKFRVVVRMRTTPFGKKETVARLLAAECGRSTRTVYRWDQLYREHGLSGLSHPRSDRGVPQLYSAAEFESVKVAAERLRRYPRSKVRREWKASGVRGSYETFRVWIRRLQAFGYQVSGADEKGERRA